MTGQVILLGAGGPDGLGGAIARRFAREGHPVIVSGRTLEKVEATVRRIQDQGGTAEARQVDVTSEADQERLFQHAHDSGTVAAVVFNAGNNAIIPFEELTPQTFEAFWRVGLYGAFLTAKRALPILKSQAKGSLLFTGASASMRGRANFAHFASMKAGLRMLAQSLAREYGPQGVHVAHIVVDGILDGEMARSRFSDYMDSLGEDGVLSPDAVAETFWSVHKQHRSAWTHELDVRPFSEAW